MTEDKAAELIDNSVFSERPITVSDHKIHLLRGPEERLHAILNLIGQARSSIKMFTYMFRDDRTGNEVLSALIAAVERGLKVQLIIDSFGSVETKAEFFSKFLKAGGKYHLFGSRWGAGYLIRNHQKILIADDKKAIVGGFNMTDNYFGRAGQDSWEDFGLTIVGQQVAALAEYYQNLSDLSQGGKTAFFKLRRLIRSWKPEKGALTWLLGGPTNRISPWALSLKHDLERASRVDIVAAYFSPSQTILRRIAKISARGGDVRLILAGKSDNGATLGAARLLYKYLLKRGVSLFEFQPRPLHMKLLVIDDACYIGSSNLDVRSLFINLEIMLRIEDNGLANKLRGVIDNMAAQSEEQTLETHRKRATFLMRLKWTLAYFLVNTVDYTIGRRIKFRLLRNRDKS